MGSATGDPRESNKPSTGNNSRYLFLSWTYKNLYAAIGEKKYSNNPMNIPNVISGLPDLSGDSIQSHPRNSAMPMTSGAAKGRMVHV